MEKAYSISGMTPKLRVERDGEPVFETVLSGQQPFHVGHRIVSDFVISPDFSIARHKFIEFGKDQLKVHLLSEFGGWLLVDGHRQSVDQLLDGKNSAVVFLDNTAAGCVKVGDHEFILEFVNDPVMPPAPSLIVENMTNVDWVTAYFLVPIMVAQIFLSAWFVLRPEPPKPKKEEYQVVASKFVKMLVKKTPPKIVENSKKEGRVGKAGQPDAAPKPTPPSKAGGGKSADRAAMVKKVSGKGLLALIGAKGSAMGEILSGNNRSRIKAALGSVTGGTGIGKQMADISGKLREGDVKHVGIGNVEGAGTGTGAGMGTYEDAKIQIGVTTYGEGGEGGEGGESGYDLKAVQKVLARNIGAFRYCYENALKKVSSLEGSFVLEFTIGTGGRVSPGTVYLVGAEASPELGRCISSRLLHLSFPPPSGFDATIRTPINFRSK